MYFPLFAQATASGSAGQIFLDFTLPNATSWFYFSLLLALALFFQFARFFSIRNLDVLTLFLLVPGLLLLRETRGSWYGYLWLFCGSGYLLARCLFDLALIRRPALSPNLNLGGLACLGAAMFGCLVAVAFRQPQDGEGLVKGSPVLDQAQQRAQSLLSHQMGTDAAVVPAEDTDLLAGRILALLCHLAVVAGLIVVGVFHFQDAHAGVAAATFYLLLPYTALHIDAWHHVWPMALIVWAVALYRLPILAGLLLGLAAGTMYFPALIFPVWCSFYWGRGLSRFATAFVVSTGLCVGVLLWVGELPESLQSALSLSDWQPWVEPSRDTEGFWTGVRFGWAYRMPVFVAYLAFLITTTLWPWPKDLAQLLALSTAALIGIQFWYGNQGGVYVLWYLPLLLLLVFRPNLSDRRPPVIRPETDWLFALGRRLGWLAALLFRVPEYPVRVH